MVKNVGATLSLKDGNFFANMKSAVSASEKLKKSLGITAKETTAFGEKLKIVSSGISTVAKGLTAAGGVASTAIGAMVTKSVNSFAEYEQLIGGVETLFKDSSEIVKDYANNAYKNAGLGANEYMNTVTSFSASLINSMGNDTEAAAVRANMAIEDMSDNANKMGSNMDSIMQTYQSISRGNYGMLDNLKLGYGGTKAEMERLLTAAEEYRSKIGKPVDYDISSFSDVVSAIHDIQEEMGITGASAKEAETTISGSANMLKASWKNALTAVTVGGDMFDKSIEDLVASASTFGKNIIPAIEKSLSGVGKLVEGLAPVIAEKLPGMVSAVLPGLVSAAGSLISSLASQIPALADAVLSSVPSLLDGAVGFLDEAVVDGLKGAFENIRNAIGGIFSGTDIDISGTIQSIANTAVPVLTNALNVIADSIKFVTEHWNVFEPLLKGVLTGFLAYKGISGVAGVISNIGGAASTVMDNMGGVSKAFGTFKTAAKGIQAAKSAGGITAMLKGFKGLSEAGAGLGKAISGLGGIFKGVGAAVTFVTSPIGIVVLAIGAVVAIFVVLWNKCEGFRNFWINLWNTVKNVASSAWNGIKAITGTVLDAAKATVSEKLNNIKSAYEEHGGGLKGVAAAVMEGVKGINTAGYDFIDKLTGGKLTAIKDKFLSIWKKVKEGISDIWKGIVNVVKGSINNVIKGMNGMIRGAVGGINKLINGVNNISSKVGIPSIPTITAPQISLLANGGILTKATLLGMSGKRAFIGGEAGAEAVLPLAQLWRQLGAFADKIIKDKQPQLVPVTNNIYITVDGRNADDKTLADRIAAKIVEVVDNI